MTRDILTLKSNKNLVIEYLSSDRIRVVGDVTDVKSNRSGDISFIKYKDGPHFRPGQISNFRTQDRSISSIHLEDRKDSTVSILLELN
jgi:hypothetical protein